MRFYWIQDRTRQEKFLIYWRPGVDDLADSLMKHHSTAHHRIMRPNFLHQRIVWRTMRFIFFCEGVLSPM